MHVCIVYTGKSLQQHGASPWPSVTLCEMLSELVRESSAEAAKLRPHGMLTQEHSVPV